MYYYEVLIADGGYHGEVPLTYSSDKPLAAFSVVTVLLRQKPVTGFIVGRAKKPGFAVKPVKTVVSKATLPRHCIQLANWISDFYASTSAEALRLFAPSRPTVRHQENVLQAVPTAQLEWHSPLTLDQKKTIGEINKGAGTTVLLHGETGSGKTRVYMELAKDVLASGKSVVLLTPEISLTAQMAQTAVKHLGNRVLVLHSQLPAAARKKIWLEILEASQPLVVVGPRSALFSPLKSPGLIVVDEAHEPAYKQEQSPRFHAVRVASQLGVLTGARVVLGTATPTVGDYWLAEQKQAISRMSKPALKSAGRVKTLIVDLKDRSNFSRSGYLSNTLVNAINTTLSAKKQIMIYLNRRGSARQILCQNCGWFYFCPVCDIPLVYHSDEHLARCHTCGFKKAPPVACPECSNAEIIYRVIGTKALEAELSRLFPQAKVGRFDSDSLAGERLNELYADILSGKLDILVGTQLLAKGLDLPHLALVGIISAEASLAMPDFSSEERTFQLLYQVIGRVGRGHTKGQVIIQSYDPKNIVIRSAAERNWPAFYNHVLTERRRYRFPPFSYLALLICRRTSLASAQQAAESLKDRLTAKGLPVEIMGPAPAFYARRGRYFYYQLVLKTKNRATLIDLVTNLPSGWQVDLDPIDLL